MKNTKIKFNIKPTESKLEKLMDQYTAIDALIGMTPTPMNPMKTEEDGCNFWNWGILTVGGIEITAPYKEYGVTYSQRKVDLTEKESMVVNTLIFLKRLLDLYKLRRSLPDSYGFYFNSGFNWINSIGEDKLITQLPKLREACYNSDNMMAVINQH